MPEMVNMRKLKLSLEDLQVDSFNVTPDASARGTVPGHNWTEYADESCFESCNGSCNQTCPLSCYGGCGSGASCGGTCGASCGCPPNTDDTACGCATWETCPGAPICA
jgi:hypothetical protein